MNLNRTCILVGLFLLPAFASAQYNQLWIPDTLSGTTFNLELKDTLAQFRPGNQTVTAAVNNSKFWGPTLIFQKGDTVHMNVTNHLNDATTIHWHGLHLPAVMDGGPHQVIPPGTIWQPYYRVKNNAATYWYHPHLHMMTNAHMTAGLGGFIIVRDAEEAALALPRTYGVDDLPLSISDRRFTTGNQFVVTNYTDSLMVNGTLRPEHTVPAQVVRLRMLNTSPQHSYNLGFSDNRSFSVIGSDGGLLNAPVSLTRFILSPGERVEILVDFGGQQGQTVDLRAYNNLLPSDITGAPITQGPSDALLGMNFRILHFTVGASTAGAITTIPTSLVTNDVIDPSTSDQNHTITLVDGFVGGFPNTSFGGVQFSLTNINYTVPLNNTEIWQITSNSSIAHTFHIHDVQFNVISRTGSTSTLQPYDMGWKDNVLVRAGETLRFITKFEDYADPTHPFMYHCHMTVHEDEGMMGQFVVTDPNMSVALLDAEPNGFTLFPNPTSERLFIDLADKSMVVYYITITNMQGRAVLMLPQPQWQTGIDISQLAQGTYVLQLMDKATKQVTTRTFVKS